MKRFILTLALALAVPITVYCLQTLQPTLSEVKENVYAYSLSQNIQDASALKNFKEVVAKDGYLLFPSALILKSATSNLILYSNNLHRLPTLIVCLISILLFAIYSRRHGLNESGIILFGVTPILISSSLFNFQFSLSLAIALLLLQTKNKLVNFILSVLITFTSIPGLIFTFILLVWKRKILFLIPILLWLGVMLTHEGIKSFLALTSFTNDDFSLSRTSFEVDNRFKIETDASDYKNIIPLELKRVSYNKFFFEYVRVLPSALKNLNIDRITAPAQIGTTVARNLWGEKGVPTFFFWQIMLAIAGVLFIKWSELKKGSQISKVGIIFFMWWVISSMVAKSPFDLALLIPISFLIQLTLEKFTFQFVRIGFWAFVLFSASISYWHFIYHEEIWQDNRFAVYDQMVEKANELPNDSNIFITNITGPTHFYYAWKNGMEVNTFWKIYNENPKLNNVTFSHFDLTKSLPLAGEYYIGFPGEFLGSKEVRRLNEFTPEELPSNYQLVSEFPIKDSISYGNGDKIWIVKVVNQ